jgi:hypothetical protein
MGNTITLIIENGSFIAIFLLCIFGVAASYKHNKTLPGADLLLLGFLLYAIHGVLSWAVSGFTGSFIADWSQTAVLKGATFPHFLAYGLRIGLILILIGIFRIGRNLKV